MKYQIVLTYKFVKFLLNFWNVLCEIDSRDGVNTILNRVNNMFHSYAYCGFVSRSWPISLSHVLCEPNRCVNFLVKEDSHAMDDCSSWIHYMLGLIRFCFTFSFLVLAAFDLCPSKHRWESLYNLISKTWSYIFWN